MDTTGFHHLRVATESEGRVVVLEFDHGKTNEMGKDQVMELEELTRRLEDDPHAVALISWSQRRTSKGTPIFISGANVTERANWRSEQIRQHVRWQRRVLTRLRLAPVFHIAVVDGLALGWGTEFLLASDWRIAGDQASFGLPETGLGILPGAGGTSELCAHLGVAQTLRLGMTGERIGADEAKQIGLVQERVLSIEPGLARARELALTVTKRSPTAIAAFKRAVLDGLGLSGELREEREARAYEFCLETGEAAIGRAHFDAIREGAEVPWGKKQVWNR